MPGRRARRAGRAVGPPGSPGATAGVGPQGSPGATAAVGPPGSPGAAAGEPSPEDWDARGCPYEAALARFDRGDEASLRAAYDALQRLGARATAAHVAEALREQGVRGVRRRPRRPTRANPPA